MFDGLRIAPTNVVVPERPSPLDRAVERFARAMADIGRSRARGHEALPHQRVAMDAAIEALETHKPHSARDLTRVFEASPALVEEADRGRTANAIRAMQLEAEIRVDAGNRADRFVTEWQRLRSQREKLPGWQNEDARHKIEARMTAMGKELARDPQVESLLRNRRIELGLKPATGASLSHDIQSWLGLSRGRGIGM